MRRGEAVLKVPEDRAIRVELALSASLEALKLARREAEGAGEDPARLRWVAVGIVSALQGALVAALSGYETAAMEAVQDPSRPGRIAPVAQLLRRAQSADYLAAPERVVLGRSAERAIARVLTVRNSAVHGLAADVPDSFAADASDALNLIRHLIVEAPAFDAARFSVLVILFREALPGLAQALAGIGPRR